MKRITSIVICLAILIASSCIAMNIAFATGTPTITCESKECNPGDTVTVDVYITNNPGIMYLELTPVYSSALGTPTVKNGEIFSDFTKGKQYVWVADEDVDTNGKLVSFTFNVAESVAPNDYSVGFTFRSAVNYDESSVSFTIVNATVSVVEKPCEHTSKTSVAAKASTCTVQGWDAYSKCDNCDQLFDANGNAISEIPYRSLASHTPAAAVSENVVPATCEAAGSHDSVVYCSVCSGELSRTPVTDNALGHDWGDWVITTEPTCTKKGVETRTCKNDSSHTETRDVNPLGHSWGNWVQTTPPTCTEKGEETRVCNNDTSHTETRDVNPLGHNYVPAVTQPTCTEQGYTTHTCSRCSDNYVDAYTDALGHDYIEKVDAKYLKSDANCTNAAVYYKSCSRCGLVNLEETFESGSPLGHNYTNTVDAKYLKSAADCTHAAVYYKSCSRCEIASTTETFESGSPLGHITVEAVKPEYLKSAADCTHAAVYYKSCSRCNSALTETFESGSPLGHITVEAVKPEYLKSAADCTHAAVYYKSCSRCNSALTETFENGSPLGHTFTKEPVVIEEPTTEKEGKKAIVCTVCGYYDEEKVDTIPKLIAYDVEQTAGIREDSKPVYDAGNSKAVAFTAKFSRSKLQTVKVNGVTLSENDYDVVEDEEFVKVTLKEDYLKKLANGNYSITLVADDGIAESTVTVKNNEAAPVVVSTETSTSSPKTGNSDIAVIVISLMAILGVSVLSSTVIRKKRKNI